MYIILENAVVFWKMILVKDYFTNKTEKREVRATTHTHINIIIYIYLRDGERGVYFKYRGCSYSIFLGSCSL